MAVEMDSSLTQDTTGTQAPAPEVQPASPEAAAAGGQPPVNATAQEILDWTKDERYKRMWSNKDMGDPNKLYKSYRELEKVYTPMKDEVGKLKGQIASVDKLLQDYGYKFDNEQLKALLTEHKSFKDPQNPLVANGQYVNQWLENELYRGKVESFFQELERAEMERKYPNMNAEQRARMIQLENEMKSLKESKAKEEDEKVFNSTITEINTGIDRIKKLSDTKGFAFSDDIKNKLLDYCKNNDIPAKFLYSTFIEQYAEELDKAAAEKVKQSQLQELERNKNKVILPAGAKGADGAAPSGDLRSRLRAVLTGR